MLAGGTPATGVVLFEGTYVVVGTVWNEPYAEPGWNIPRYDPSRNWGVVWTSPDGHAWTLHDKIATFAHASLLGVVTDGTRLVAYGYYAAPVAGQDARRVGATWVSSDGIHWTRSASPAPAIVAAGPKGFVGVLVTEDAQPLIVKVRFAVSADGVTWTPTSKTYDANVGEPDNGMAYGVPNEAIAVNAAGAVLVVGTLNYLVPNATQSAVYWESPDGRTWGDPVTFIPGGSSDAVIAAGDAFLVRAAGTTDAGAMIGPFWRVTPGGYMAGVPVPFDLSAGASFVALGNFVLNGTTDDTGHPHTWLSADGGLTYAPVPNVLFEVNGVAPITWPPVRGQHP